MGALEMAWDGTNWAPVSERPEVARGYRAANRWLTGAVMTKCLEDSATGTWVAELVKIGSWQTLVWNAETTRTFNLNPLREYNTLETMDGTLTDISGRTEIQVGPEPVLLTSGNTVSSDTCVKTASFVRLSLFPNPANPMVTLLAVLPPLTQAEYRILDIQGKVVFVKKLSTGAAVRSHRLVWNSRGAASGIYIAQLRTNGRTAASRRIILQK
jgi:hypothetical protein